MSKKDNFNQAMYDMFGVGKDGAASSGETETRTARPAEQPAAVQSRVSNEPIVAPAVDRTSVPAADRTSAPVIAPVFAAAAAPVAPAVAVTYIAPGVVLEGKLTATGDVEIAGDFKGEITTEGSVIIRNTVEATITAAGLQVLGSTLNGDSCISGQVLLDDNSVVNGSIIAGDLVCSAVVNGDLTVKNDLALDSHARVKGNVSTGNLAMARGARISGHIEMKDME